MSEYDYLVSMKIARKDYPFYALIMAAMRQADSINLERLKVAFPAIWADLVRLYSEPLPLPLKEW